MSTPPLSPSPTRRFTSRCKVPCLHIVMWSLLEHKLASSRLGTSCHCPHPIEASLLLLGPRLHLTPRASRMLFTIPGKKSQMHFLLFSMPWFLEPSNYCLPPSGHLIYYPTFSNCVTIYYLCVWDLARLEQNTTHNIQVCPQLYRQHVTVCNMGLHIFLKFEKYCVCLAGTQT